jgi:hypothetical protein
MLRCYSRLTARPVQVGDFAAPSPRETRSEHSALRPLSPGPLHNAGRRTTGAAPSGQGAFSSHMDGNPST